MGGTVSNYDGIARKLKVMGHPVRLQILDMLRNGEICVCHIENALHKRQAYVSQHLMTLRNTGLVASRKDGLQVYYRLADDHVYDLLNLLISQRDVAELDALPGCNCPSCTTLSITSVN